MERLDEIAAAAHQAQLLRKWLGRWRLALRRARTLAAREQQRQQALLACTWAAWKQRCQEARLCQALEVAAQLHRQAAVLRCILRSWRAHAASLRQVDLPADHPTMVKAARLRRARLLAFVFQVRASFLFFCISCY